MRMESFLRKYFNQMKMSKIEYRHLLTQILIMTEKTKDQSESEYFVSWNIFKVNLRKEPFFIAFTSVMLSLLCSTYTITGYVTDIFNKTGSSFTEKNSSILIAVITLLTNLLFLYIVERLNRKVWLNYDEQLNNEL